MRTEASNAQRTPVTVRLVTVTHRAPVAAVSVALDVEPCVAIHVSGKVRSKGGASASAMQTYVLHVLFANVARTNSICWGANVNTYK